MEMLKFGEGGDIPGVIGLPSSVDLHSIHAFAEQPFTQIPCSLLLPQLHALVTKVEEAKNSLKSATDRGTLIEALMVQKRQGHIPGIFGRLVRTCIYLLLLVSAETYETV